MIFYSQDKIMPDKNKAIARKIEQITGRIPDQITTARDSAVLLDALQDYAQLLDRLAANPAEHFDRDDGSVTIKVDGQGVKFANVDTLANYLATVME
jgi:hypothetical protein